MNIKKMKINKKKIIISLLIIISSVLFLGLVVFSCKKANEIVRFLIVEEQKRDFGKIEKIIDETEKDLARVDVKLVEIKDSGKIYLSDDESGDLLEILDDLENDSLRIGNALSSYENDLTVQLYPEKDLIMDKKMDSLWGLHVKINRLVRNVEDIAFTDRIYNYNIEISQKNLKHILDRIKSMREL